MGRAKLNVGEIETDSGLVRRLLRHQFPRLAELPIEVVPSHGTDHDIYRLGDQLCARLPRTGWAAGQAELEAVWLPRFAPRLPLTLPVQVGLGQPADGYPFTWSVCQWLPGDNASGGIGDLGQAAVDLVGFVTALRLIDIGGAPPRLPSRRGGPLVENEERVRRSIEGLGDRIDAAALTRSWEESLAARPWDRDVWVHGDLLPGNLLVNHGRLTAVIDWGGLNAGDPACDLQPAWNIFAGQSRELFLSELGADGDARLRGRGWALFQAVTGLYYWGTNPGMVRQAAHAVAQVLADT
jgi:aminoglycoside phosphotransferase (APT) family kinase protein